MRLFPILAATMLALAGCAAAPVTPPAVAPLDHLPALKGDYFPITSRDGAGTYHIYVRLPDGYDVKSARHYPVVYLLDGDSLFPIIGANHIFLTYDDKMPEAVVVGIAYGSFAKPQNRRHIDFMPPGPQESGIERFHRFLEGELLPAVESRYLVDPERRILFGQSRGGALVLYSAFIRPDLFWGRIASNPSWEPGQEIFYGPPPSARRRDLNLLIAIGSEEHPGRRAAAAEWFSHWSGKPKPWAVSRIDISGGTHAANAGDAYRQALRQLFPVR